MLFADYEMVANEVKFRDAASQAVNAYQVQEVLNYGHSYDLEQYEIEAIKREAASMGVY